MAKPEPRPILWAGAFVGKYHEHMTELFYDDGSASQTERSANCTVCRTRSVWRHSPKGWAIHPGCDHNYMDAVAPELVVEALFNLAAAFPAMHPLPARSGPPEPPVKVLGNPAAGCEVCGRPYAAPWIVARTWRCGAHRLSLVPAKTPYWWA